MQNEREGRPRLNGRHSTDSDTDPTGVSQSGGLKEQHVAPQAGRNAFECDPASRDSVSPEIISIQIPTGLKSRRDPEDDSSTLLPPSPSTLRRGLKLVKRRPRSRSPATDEVDTTTDDVVSIGNQTMSSAHSSLEETQTQTESDDGPIIELNGSNSIDLPHQQASSPATDDITTTMSATIVSADGAQVREMGTFDVQVSDAPDGTSSATVYIPMGDGQTLTAEVTGAHLPSQPEKSVELLLQNGDVVVVTSAATPPLSPPPEMQQTPPLHEQSPASPTTKPAVVASPPFPATSAPLIPPRNYSPRNELGANINKPLPSVAAPAAASSPPASTTPGVSNTPVQSAVPIPVRMASKLPVADIVAGTLPLPLPEKRLPSKPSLFKKKPTAAVAVDMARSQSAEVGLGSPLYANGQTLLQMGHSAPVISTSTDLTLQNIGEASRPEQQLLISGTFDPNGVSAIGAMPQRSPPLANGIILLNRDASTDHVNGSLTLSQTQATDMTLPVSTTSLVVADEAGMLSRTSDCSDDNTPLAALFSTSPPQPTAILPISAPDRVQKPVTLPLLSGLMAPGSTTNHQTAMTLPAPSSRVPPPTSARRGSQTLPRPSPTAVVISPRMSSLANPTREEVNRRRFTYLGGVDLQQHSEGGAVEPFVDEVVDENGHGITEGTPHTITDSGTATPELLLITPPKSIPAANTDVTIAPLTPTDPHLTPRDLATCPLCADVCERAMRVTCCLTVCCSACIWRWLALAQHNTCPFCRAPIAPENVRPAEEVQHLVDRLVVRCKVPGCGWMGTRERLKRHVVTDCRGACDMVVLRKKGSTVRRRSSRASLGRLKLAPPASSAPSSISDIQQQQQQHHTLPHPQQQPQQQQQQPPRRLPLLIPLRSSQPRILFRRLSSAIRPPSNASRFVMPIHASVSVPARIGIPPRISSAAAVSTSGDDAPAGDTQAPPQEGSPDTNLNTTQPTPPISSPQPLTDLISLYTGPPSPSRTQTRTRPASLRRRRNSTASTRSSRSGIGGSVVGSPTILEGDEGEGYVDVDVGDDKAVVSPGGCETPPSPRRARPSSVLSVRFNDANHHHLVGDSGDRSSRNHNAAATTTAKQHRQHTYVRRRHTLALDPRRDYTVLSASSPKRRSVRGVFDLVPPMGVGETGTEKRGDVDVDEGGGGGGGDEVDVWHDCTEADADGNGQ
ncbi:uncharacterized protein EV422DRAFT_579699 [Fimicolochytrium jonesii]|uniref:uncharacterized protein n=1 Tax=Fimicolochytrium jonesii TaxID=1396493 RepID=UPI0022FEF1E3|nr:uncharacterized protein EV422DRAFT_579699 [Fimicolochytrium jonesii]KAI8818927.1 hypothetical protein EV422DRAFT_579699 [Fimicolochytrium jonesii]